MCLRHILFDDDSFPEATTSNENDECTKQDGELNHAIQEIKTANIFFRTA